MGGIDLSALWRFNSQWCVKRGFNLKVNISVSHFTLKTTIIIIKYTDIKSVEYTLKSNIASV